MSFYQPDEPIDLEDDAEGEYMQGIDAIVVAIDCSPRMQEVGALADAPDQSFLQSSLMAALDIMQRKIITSESDVISVVLFGTQSRQNPLGHEHIHIL
jgi:hypothetical protein